MLVYRQWGGYDNLERGILFPTAAIQCISVITSLFCEGRKDVFLAPLAFSHMGTKFPSLFFPTTKDVPDKPRSSVGGFCVQRWEQATRFVYNVLFYALHSLLF